MTTFKGLREKWNSLKRKTVMWKLINTAFINKTLSLTSEECIFPHSDWILRNTPYLYVFSSNAGKCGPEKLRTWKLFIQCKQVTGKKYVLKFYTNDIENVNN